MQNQSMARTVLAALILWIAGVIIIRLTDHLVLVEGTGIITGYICAALGGPPSVWICSKIIGCKPDDMAVPTLIVCALALMADGFVMEFTPTVYTDPQKIKFLAPLFLWTFGCAALSGFVMSKGSLEFKED
ncbi:MAG: hypothetical protein AAFV72_25200 [Cyanobacteria bacterium J06635_1]